MAGLSYDFRFGFTLAWENMYEFDMKEKEAMSNRDFRRCRSCGGCMTLRPGGAFCPHCGVDEYDRF